MISKIQPMGAFIIDCTLPGHRKADGVYPAHPNACQVSKHRWLVVYGTRGWRFDDDERSVIYQLRENAPDGRVIKEDFVARWTDDWEPYDDGRRYWRLQSHSVPFGVPKGALINGVTPPHANLFVIKWRQVGVRIGNDEGQVDRDYNTMSVQWLQCRLNDREDDIEIVQAPAPMRQRGCEEGDAICRPPDGQTFRWMNQSHMPPVACNHACTEWADVNHFDGGRIAPLKYACNPSQGCYEWVQFGPMTGGGDHPVFEAGLVKLDGSWLIAARRRSKIGAANEGVAWMRTDDLFKHVPMPVDVPHPPAYAPLTIFRAADGVLRLFTPIAPGSVHRMWDLDPAVSGPRGIRNPLRCWDIDPHSFTPSNERILFDSYEFGLPIRPESNPTIDMAKLLPHAGGNEQYLLHRVRPDSLEIPCTNVLVNDEEKACAGIYFEKILYHESYPAVWTFA